MNPSTPSTTPAAKASSETGFVIIERLLQERRQRGRSATLDRWLTDAKARITQYRAAVTAPKAQQEIATVEKAIETAAELVETLAAGNRATGPSGAR
jgi:hypothetical protein